MYIFTVDGAKKLKVVAPTGFTFAENCLGQGTTSFTAVKALVNHPKAVPSSYELSVSLEDGGVVTQAVVTTAMPLKLMNAAVVYQPIAATANLVAVRLTPSVEVDGGTLTLDVPEGYGVADGDVNVLGANAKFHAEVVKKECVAIYIYRY